ncbi:MAG TPA: GNAT family N-acetyltransferase [Acidimicrobiia bacterium]|nr:GNAT family N-acetyltransferase [Acidimicrobiia bacterium]
MTVAIRPAIAGDAPAIARVRIDGWRTAYRGLVPDTYLDAMDVDASVTLWQRILTAAPNAASVFVADDDGEVVGFAAGNMLEEPRHDLDAELSAAYVRRDHQRTSIGRRLVCAVAHAQRGHGANGLIVWTLPGNRAARAFFEALGATLVAEQPFEWDGLQLDESGYGFTNLDALLTACDEAPRTQALASASESLH